MADQATPMPPAAAPAPTAAPASEGEAAPGTGPQNGSTTQPAKKAPPKEVPWSAFFSSPWFIILLAVWLWVFWSARKQKAKDRARKDELNALKKGERIVTVGGLHGTVVNVTDDTMTIKPDDKQPTTLTFNRQALLKKLTPDDKKESE